MMFVVGHLRYESRVSGNMDWLPVAVGMLGPPGRDLALLRVAVEHCRGWTDQRK
jgi:hypothetical protein